MNADHVINYNFENLMFRLAKQKSNDANQSNLYPTRRVILEKHINNKI